MFRGRALAESSTEVSSGGNVSTGGGGVPQDGRHQGCH